MSFGVLAAIFFMLVVNEPDLVHRSKMIYDKYFLLVPDEVDSDGKLFDEDDELSSNLSLDDTYSPKFGN